MCADAPNTKGMNQAAKDSAALGKEAFAWFSGEMARTQDQRDATTALQNEVATQQRDLMAKQNDLSGAYVDYEKGTVLPLKQQIVDEAKAYDTPGRQEAAADAATADVRAATNRGVASSSRTLARMGYTPSINATKMAQQAAVAEAGAATNARRTVENTGRAMRMDAAGMQSSATTAATAGANAGQVAAGASGQALGSATSGADLMRQGFGLGMQGAGQAGSIYGQQANIQANSGGLDLGGLGKLGEGAAALWKVSDERLKDNTGKPLSGAKARMAIERMPVDEDWTYERGSVADDGGAPHDGPMAKDVQRLMGDRAAPGGKMVDMITIQGNLISAVGDISKEVRALTARMDGGGRRAQAKPPRSLARM